MYSHDYTSLLLFDFTHYMRCIKMSIRWRSIILQIKKKPTRLARTTWADGKPNTILHSR